MVPSRALLLLIALLLVMTICITTPLLVKRNRGSSVPETSSSVGNQVPSPSGDETAAAGDESDTSVQLVAPPKTNEAQLTVSSPDEPQLAPPAPDNSVYEDEEGNVVASVDWDLFAASFNATNGSTEHDVVHTSKSRTSEAPSPKLGTSKSSKVSSQSASETSTTSPEAKSGKRPGKAGKRGKNSSDDFSETMWKDLVAIANAYVDSASTLFHTPTPPGGKASKEKSKSGKSKSSKAEEDVPLHSVPSPSIPETTSISSTSATASSEMTSTAMSEVTSSTEASDATSTSSEAPETTVTAPTDIATTTSAATTTNLFE